MKTHKNHIRSCRTNRVNGFSYCCILVLALAFDPKAQAVFELADELCAADEGVKKELEMFVLCVGVRFIIDGIEEFVNFFDLGDHFI